ncbi:hypothetical protein PB2503_00415 [Parvularcula bermudensis HTCC2503]|uniref:Metal ion efflux outer membrane factor protein family protein n=1 Tax=Parvularcula bermudensis (strain ATCC BAA-594 / HTCC2503 / KCTC 12087) TaxID=314260 RepID=E0TIJ2_PARBH|nr:TolC family protein [Parvularcula bermudensis]ADM10850.1 hypothetical protein PB2503_00415 [Parvularcula bermudensis HTCC2503]
MNTRHLSGAALAVLASLSAANAAAQTLCPLSEELRLLEDRAAPYTLDAALAAIRDASPEVQSAALEAVARRYEAQQASLWTNPVVSVEAENFYGDAFGSANPLSGYDFAETTVSIGQTFRLGGKRRLERRAALARTALAEADRDATLRALQREAAAIFYELAAAQEGAQLAAEAARLSNELADAVRARVDAGKSPRTALDRAIAAQADARAAAAASAAQAEQLAYALGSFWGRRDPVEIAGASLFAPTVLPSAELVANQVETHPERRLADARRDARLAERRAARAQANPDVTASLGVRRFEADGTEALVAGVSLPLPLFDRNQGNIRAASTRARGAAYEADVTAARLAASAQRSLSTAAILETRRAALVDDALPAARRAAEAARTGYRAGKFDLTTALAAQTSLITVQRSAITAAFAARDAEAEVRALAALPPFSPSFCQETDR